MAKTPITARPLDLFYFIFLLSHVFASLLIDLQYLYPSRIVPEIIRKLPEYYIQMSNDPVLGGLMGYFGNNHHFMWFKSFLYLEALFQLPVFFLGMRGLWQNSRSIYVLLLVYAASTTTTTLPCLFVILTTPVVPSEAATQGVALITPHQRFLLLSSYVPFFLVPLVMTLDMAARVLGLIRLGINIQNAEKVK